MSSRASTSSTMRGCTGAAETKRTGVCLADYRQLHTATRPGWGTDNAEDTGNRSAGFLGSHLCERLLARGHDALCVDSYFTGRKANIAHLLDNRNFEILWHDVTFPLYVAVDEIYHLACPMCRRSQASRPGPNRTAGAPALRTSSEIARGAVGVGPAECPLSRAPDRLYTASSGALESPHPSASRPGFFSCNRRRGP